jgi:puromycin-sensitive aminopeptidase
MGKNVTRLYSSLQPKHYKLHITPDKQSQTFTGSVIITGKKVGRPTQRMTLHQSGLTITDAHITHHDKKGDKEVSVDRINHHKSFDEVRLHTTQSLYPGLYSIRLEFKGNITRPMNGLYPCFFEHEGQQKQLLATQFESHHAREVFPCIDEPEAKATFDLSLTTITGEEVIANTPIKSQESHSDTQTTVFETTPIMSTYLLAFATGEVGYKEAKTKRGVTVRTYATPDNVEMTAFALDVAVKTLEFYEDYFGIDYPLAKCDMIALPDFASGAMENWGLITYREHTLLVDEQNTTLGTKQYVAMVVAHELAHQWFGNLVTMRWWTDLWLNEGFASWIEYMAVDHLFPEWDMWTQFNVDEQQQALKLDALEHTHPIEVPVNHPDEIRSIFDAISYSKGASVIHMLHEYLGAEDFKNGLRHYLTTHAYGNTDTIDLWQALEEISGKPVKEFMHAWTTQSGFPVVHTTVEDKTVSLRQERFFLNPNHDSLPASYWPVALLDNSKDAPEQFSEETTTFELPETTNFKLNVGQSGFYRTTYNSSHLKHLGEQIKKGRLDPTDRIGILSDMFETAKAGESDTADALYFLENFRDETNYAAWDVIATALGGLRTVMDDEDLREEMKPYTRELIAHELKRLGWDRKDSDNHFDRLLRPIILGVAAAADVPEIVEHCKKLFAAMHDVDDISPDLRSAATNKEVKRGSDIDPDMRGVVFGTIARLGDEKDFDRLVALHNSTTLSDERLTLSAAITGFKQPQLIERALSMINSEHVRLQDVAYWVAYSFLNRYGRKQTWEWVQANWEWLHENLGTDLSFYRMPIYVARVHSDESFIKEYEAFFKPRLSPAMERSYKQGIEMLQWQSAWKARAFKEVKAFFKAHPEK